MVYLNVYECHLQKDDLYVWQYPSADKNKPQQIGDQYDAVLVDTKRTPAVAVPKNSEAIITLERDTSFESRMVPWEDYLWIYKNLVQYSFVRHLVENHDFAPLQVDQNAARINQVYEVYNTKPIAEPIDGLEIRQGLKFRTRFWNLPEQGPFVGVNLAYTTTNYFTKPLDEVLVGVDSQGYWLKMNCPSDCLHEECTFHGQTGLIGQFDGFTSTGEMCRYDEQSDRYVTLSASANGITTNPPAERVSIEPSYGNIRQWAVDKYGPTESSIIEHISRQRLGIPNNLSDSRIRERKSKFEQQQLKELVRNIDRDIELITNQPALFSERPIEIIV